MEINDIIQYLESVAPPSLQESYDNSGLLIGDRNSKVTGVMLCLDCVEEVIDEAISKNCNLVIAHHPIIFSGLKKITGRNYVERTILKAIKNNIAIYAIHTNLDNIKTGVNARIGDILGIKNRKILAPKNGLLKKLYTYVPVSDTQKVLDALFKAGAGNIGNYSECSFSVTGHGTFKGNDDSTPSIGQKGERHTENENKIEVLLPFWMESTILKALFKNHPYEEVAYEIVTLDNKLQDVGSGMIGELGTAMDEKEFLDYLKEKMKVKTIRHTKLLNKKIKKVAWCGGAGFFLLQDAIRSKADIYITSDVKYHEFFDAENHLILADIGHYESEQFTIQLFNDLLKEKFGNFALYFTNFDTNPINYT